MHCFFSSELTSTGGRPENEDYFLSTRTPGAVCYVIADGLGGHGSGAKASALACHAAIASFLADDSMTPEAVRRHLEAANEAVIANQSARDGSVSMRTTIAVLLLDATRMVWGNVGDSRIYHFRSGRLLRQTRDHSVPQMLVDAGEISPGEVRGHVDRNRLLNALGETPELRCDVLPEALLVEEGDAFLLCTDGFWEFVLESEAIQDRMASRTPGEWMRKMEARLQLRAHGSHDNYSACAVMIAGDRAQATPSALVDKDEKPQKPRAWQGWSYAVLALCLIEFLAILLLIHAQKHVSHHQAPAAPATHFDPNRPPTSGAHQ